MCFHRLRRLALGLFAASMTIPEPAAADRTNPIRPWGENPRYWQLGDKPVLLAGGFDDDNPFQIARIEPLLDKVIENGGNFLRNTMSDRRDMGHEIYAYARRGSKYDLDRWDPRYWRRFANFLEQTEKRGIVVQIELWDRFDLSREHWTGHPYNPQNNVNYDGEKSGLSHEYPRHPGTDVQPFFHTVPRSARCRRADRANGRSRNQ
jgi:hypothetical protein